MGSTYRFLALKGDVKLVLDWFAKLELAPELIPSVKGQGLWLYFSKLGQLFYESATGELDSKRSPLASLFLPETRYNVLWTAAEVHFLATPLAAQFPDLQRINRQFAAWVRSFDLVLEPPRHREERSKRRGQWDYFLAGTLRNWDTPIYALPEGMAALRAGQYFVSHGDNEAALFQFCRSLRHRGVEGLPTALQR